MKLFPKTSHRILEDGATETTVDTGGVRRVRVKRPLESVTPATGEVESAAATLARIEAHVSACLRGLRPELDGDAYALLQFVRRAAAALKRGDCEEIAARCLDVGQRFAVFELRRVWEPSVAVHRSTIEGARSNRGHRKGSIASAIRAVPGWAKLPPSAIWKKVSKDRRDIDEDSFRRALSRLRKNPGH